MENERDRERRLAQESTELLAVLEHPDLDGHDAFEVTVVDVLFRDEDDTLHAGRFLCQVPARAPVADDALDQDADLADPATLAEALVEAQTGKRRWRHLHDLTISDCYGTD